MMSTSIIGWQYIHILSFSAFLFTAGIYLLFQNIPENLSGWIIFFTGILIMAYGASGAEIWHKSMAMFPIGYILGANIHNAQQRNRKIKGRPVASGKKSLIMEFSDSKSQKLIIEFSTQEKKGIFGRVKTIQVVHLKIGKEWATYDLKDLDRESFEEGQLAESVASSDGPVFIANVDWAEEHSLFHQQVAGVPAHWWVLCFMNFETNPVQAVFSPEKFEEFLTLVHSGQR